MADQTISSVSPHRLEKAQLSQAYGNVFSSAPMPFRQLLLQWQKQRQQQQ